MSVFDTKKHSNVNRRAKYRRIKKHHKSLEKYKKEQTRRKLIFELEDQGLTNKAIAAKVGISKRTLQRVLDSAKPYIKRNKKHFRDYETPKILKQLDDSIIKINDGVNAPLSIKKKLELIRELDICWSKTSRIVTCKELTITIDAEAAVNNHYAIRFKPCLPVNLLEYGRITLELEMFGKSQRIGRMYLGEAKGRCIKLETNQSLNLSIEPTLTCLKDIFSNAKTAIANQANNSANEKPDAASHN